MEFSEGCIISRLDAISRAFPDHPALVYGSTTTSYDQLKRLSKSYAHWLESSGIGELDRVLVDLQRSDLQVVIQIALLRLGAVYVPRNTDIADIQKIVSDCGIRACIADSPDKLDLNIDVLRPPQNIGHLDLPGRYEHPRSPDWPVCILTTSGTTGKPKYLLLPSRSHVNLLTGNWYCTFDHNTRILYHSPASFDAATVEIWSALLNGGTLVISRLHTFDVDALFAEITRFEVNTLWLTSAVFSNIVTYRIDNFGTLQYVMTGGDSVSAADVRKFKEAYPTIDLVNCWGPAENGTFSTCARFTSDTHIEDPLQIGRPINGINVYLISDQGRLIKNPGITGRIYVSGAGMFLGYLRGDAFDLPLISHEDIPEKIFDTGDYGEFSEQGNIQFFGRRDDLVKIGGKRIYLNNLSEQIVSDAGVDYCHAHPVGEFSNKMLDLFIVANASQSIDNGWHEYHDSAYKSGLSNPDQSGLYAGWINPSTGEDIPRSHMDQWRDEYCKRVGILKGSRYFDIGCGSGMFLAQNIPVDQYVGIDISLHAVNYLRNRYSAEVSSGRFTLVAGDAVEYLKHADLIQTDVILLNSVVTYLKNKYAVRDLLSELHRTVYAKYLYLGDLVSDVMRCGTESNSRSAASIPHQQTLYELAFSFTEIFSLLRCTLGDVELIFMPKLCADLNEVFRQRYDIIVRKAGDRNVYPARDIRRMDISEINGSTTLTADTLINVGNYDNYLSSLPVIREIKDRLHSNGLSVCPFYESPSNKRISLAVSHDPFDMIFSLHCVDLATTPTCDDMVVAQRTDRKIRKLLGNSHPIRKVHLLYYLPTTGRGKIDRSLITLIEQKHHETDNGSTASVVCDILNVDAHDLQTNVFDLGITSLHAMRAALKMEHDFQVLITPKTIFELATIENIVDYIDAKCSMLSVS